MSKRIHAAVALNGLGARLGTTRIPVSPKGCRELEMWACAFGWVRAFRIEGTGSDGAGLSPALVAQGHTVVEVNRPNRQLRHQQGKSDTLDAEGAARSVLAGQVCRAKENQATGGIKSRHLSFTKPAEPIFKTISGADTYADAATERRHLKPVHSGRFSGLNLHRPLNVDTNLINAGPLRRGPMLDFHNGRTKRDLHQLPGLPTLSLTVGLGLFGEFWLTEDTMRLRAEITQGVRAHDGILVKLAGDLIGHFGQFTLSGGPQLVLADTAATRLDFDVPSSSSSRNQGFKPYGARGGLRSAEGQ